MTAAAAAAVLVSSLRGEPRAGAERWRRGGSSPPIFTRRPLARAVDCQSTDAVQAASRPEDREFLSWVEWKYRYLLADAQLSGCARERLERLLAARERAARDVESGDSRAELDDIDRLVGTSIPAADRAQYEALRDSDAEQRRLADYVEGIRNLAPLGDEQERAVLRAKLERKREFESEIREAGLERARLSDGERMRALAIVQQALDRYRDEFLDDASQFLDEEQLSLLRNYERTEFQRESERLQIAINAR